MRALAIAGLLVGCTEPVTVEPGCGNFVLEQGEDCDRPGGVCTSDCRVACIFQKAPECAVVDGAAAVDGMCCPTGASCGADGACRTPSGSFVSSTPTPFVQAPFAGEFRLGDLDGDGASDALGTGSGTIITRYGGTSPFAVGVQRTAPFSNNAITIGDYTADGRDDVLIPTAGGVALFEASTGAPEPVAVPVAIVPDRVNERVAGGPDVLIGMGAGSTSNGLTLELASVKADSIQSDSRRPCGAQGLTSDRIYGHGLRTFVESAVDGARRMSVPMVLLPAVDTDPPVLCIELFDEAFQAQTGQPPPPIAVSLVASDGVIYRPLAGGEVVIADLEPTRSCPDIALSVVRDDTPDTLRNVIVVGEEVTPGSCSFSTDVTEIAVSASVVLGAVTVAAPAPRSVLIAQDALLDLTNGAIITSATRPWTQIATGDVNNDGLEDFAAITASQLDVEVFEQVSGPGVAWRVHRIPTSGFVVDVVAGDFDGDGSDDIAFVTLDAVANQAVVSVSFRDGSVFGPPELVTTLDAYHQLAAAPITDPSLFDPILGASPLDNFDDLVIVHGGDASDGVIDQSDQAKVTFLLGGTSRQLSSAWLPTPVAGRPRVTKAIASVLGSRGPAGVPDMISVFSGSSVDDPSCISQGELEVARIRAAGSADTIDHAATIPACVFQKVGGAGQRQRLLLLELERYVVVPDPDGDIVLGFSILDQSSFFEGQDASDHCGVQHRLGVDDTINPLLCSAALEPGSMFDSLRFVLTNVLRVELIGDHELLVVGLRQIGAYGVFRIKIEADAGGVRLVDVVDMSAGIEAKLGDAVVCQDATFAELGTRDVDGQRVGDGRELVFACNDVVSFELHAVASYAVAESDDTSVVDLGGLGIFNFGEIEAGDINADGLDDIAVAELGGTLRALLQCDTRGCQ